MRRIMCAFEQLSDRVIDIAGERVRVGHGLAIGVHAEARAIADGRHTDRDGVAIGERDDRIDATQGAAAHIQLFGRSRDIGNHEVERARACDEPR